MKTIKIALILLCLLHQSLSNAGGTYAICPKDLNNSDFRNMIIANVELAAGISDTAGQFSSQTLDHCLSNHYQEADWTMQLSCYQKGKVQASAQLTADTIDTLIHKTVRKIQDQGIDVKKCQFKCDFSYYPDRHYAFIDYQGQGLELAGNRVAVRNVSVDLIKKQIKDSLGYLRRVQHPELNGFYKFYDAGSDKHEAILRTIYSASALYTYMLAEKSYPEWNLKAQFKPIASYILSQQIKTGPERGAFYYSFDLKTRKAEKRVVVGTASKTIFTLLALHHYDPKDTEYLQSAIEAGNWLSRQVEDDGQIIPVKTFHHQQWVAQKKQSILYSGQVLAALSRLYLVVPNPVYLEKGEKIAKQFIEKIKNSGPLLGDDYRPANLISTSWAMRSLMDFYQAKTSHASKEIKQAGVYLSDIQLLANTINQLQIKNLQDISYAGKFSDSMTASGNGWLNEVLGDYYPFCQKNHLANCASFLQASILSTRYLLQNAYRQNNSYNIANPAFAEGAFALRYSNYEVRTDSVCHGVNSFLYLLNNLPAKTEILLDIPEQSLQTLLPLIRAGNKPMS